MTPDLWIMIAILLVCVALSAFFSSSETAFTSANKVKLKTMMQNGKSGQSWPMRWRRITTA